MQRRRALGPEEERAYLLEVKRELEAAQTKDDVIAVWTRHYMTIGHRKLGRLLVGQSVEMIMRARE